LRTLASAQPAQSPPAPLTGAQGSSANPASRRAFDTIETKFFKDGDELATPPPADNEWDEITAVCDRPRRKRGLVTWLALAAVAFLAFTIFACWRAHAHAEPSHPAPIQVER
jgi:hypothetical protein